jgi:ribosomal protein L24E
LVLLVVVSMFSGLRVHRSALPDGPPLGKGTLTVKVDSHFFIRANKKERRAARKAGTTEVT